MLKTDGIKVMTHEEKLRIINAALYHLGLSAQLRVFGNREPGKDGIYIYRTASAAPVTKEEFIQSFSTLDRQNILHDLRSLAEKSAGQNEFFLPLKDILSMEISSC